MQMQPEHTEGAAPVQRGLICNDIFRGQMEQMEEKQHGWRNVGIIWQGNMPPFGTFLEGHHSSKQSFSCKFINPSQLPFAHTMVVSLSMRSSMV